LNVGLWVHVFADLRSIAQTMRFVPARVAMLSAIGESWIRTACTIGAGGAGAATTSGRNTPSC
jgi:hypothetical protein